MEVSPFPYQGPLQPNQVHGRHHLIRDLIERVSEHRVTALLGPRRYGKTSVLRRVAADVIAGGAAVVWVDLYEVASLADLAARFDDALARITGRIGERLGRLAAAAQLNLGVVKFSLRAPVNQRPDAVLTTHSLLDVITQLATERPVVLIIDEFSDIAKVEGAAGLLRTRLQHHFQDLGLVFAGSEPSMMRMLFNDQSQPFYAQADLIEIDPLSPLEVITLVQEGFTATGREAGVLAGHIAEFCGGHPQRTMQTADTAWRLVAPGGAGDAGIWADTLQSLRTTTGDGNERLYSSLQDKEKAVLRVLAHGASIFGAGGELLDLSTGAAQHARDRLVDRGHLHKVGQRYQLVDPVLADWLRYRFPL